ncbi:hypothetical protein [Psychroserpens sp.]|uniref:hypothetical protein n=1 Tax=Psychroserpens sp. TaxID=2020870 RepID=UPI001B28ED04|nr:hypothetical protein [Psychroserpens sp.]MBO6607938.1 hypothetical protein [Psychroserpens sp.]MBO6630634.1 hypothetical protein [Psychroserpens sp.]MBO6654935.1 hypothetical protein [Psychroserpens sp.]MBO6682991.1 hypothetical protein [Psychroserpens sp.]MBO6751296.1 hypothetical protein [Psychroserpens sp.]
MKSIKDIVGISIITLLLTGCSSVKVTDSWKDVKTTDIKDKTIMVVTQTSDKHIRRQFESDLVDELNKEGYSSKESYSILSTGKSEEPLSKEELERVKQNLKEKNIDVVIMTVLKDVNEYTKTETTGGTVYSINTHPTFYLGRYGRGFYRSYNTIYLNSEPTTTTVYNGKTYILETLVYDLSLPDTNQLLSVTTTVLDNPDNIEHTSKDFSKQIVKELIN